MSHFALAAFCVLFTVLMIPTSSFARDCTTGQQFNYICTGDRVIHVSPRWNDGYLEGIVANTFPDGTASVNTRDHRRPNDRLTFVLPGKRLAKFTRHFDQYFVGHNVAHYSHRWNGGLTTGRIKSLYENGVAVVQTQDAKTTQPRFFAAPARELKYVGRSRLGH